MQDKKQARLRRARKTRAKIAELKVNRLVVIRTNSHIYASVISAEGNNVLATASTVQAALRANGNGPSACGRTWASLARRPWRRPRTTMSAALPC